jgi:hypothetical protein
MREWEGIRDDTSDVGGTGFSSATGISFTVEGELRRRAGLTYLASYGGNALAHFRSPITGAWLLVCRSNGDIESIDL